MQIKQSDNTNNQSELIVAGGYGKNSHISVLKKGISVKNVHTIRDLPLIADNGIFTLEDKIFIKFFGLDSLVVLQASVGLEKSIQLTDLPINPNLMVNEEEEVILIRKCSQN
jgi:hypothetical protein